MGWLSMHTEEEQSQIKAACLLLRYRTTDPSSKSYKYYSYHSISKALRVPYNTVQHVCRYAVTPKRKPR